MQDPADSALPGVPASAAGSGGSAQRDFRQEASGGGTNIARDQINVYGQQAQELTALHQLPRPLRDFTGRTSELDHLEASVTGELERGVAPVVLVYGMGGIGKTTVAVQLAHQLKPVFPSGQLLVRLGGIGVPALSMEQALDRLLSAFGLDTAKLPMDTEARVAVWQSVLEGRRVLVVFDNATQAGQVEPLLPASGGCGMLLTSRGTLAGLDGVTRYPLPPFPVKDAVELLEAVVGAERVAADRGAAARVVGLCGELPLAVRVAGASMTLPATIAQPLGALADRLADESGRLDLLSDAERKDRAVRASFQVSVQTLSPETARLFRLLGLLGVPDFGVEVVAAFIDVEPAVAARRLAELVNAQLLQVAGPAGERYRFHDLVRLFARERAEEEDVEEERSTALRRAFGWYLETTGEASQLLSPLQQQPAVTDTRSRFSSYDAALNWLEAERPNIVSAIRQASGNRWDELTWQLADSLFDFFNLRKYWQDWQETSELGLEAAQRRRPRDRDAEGRMLHNLGYVLRDRRQFQDAVTYLEESLKAFKDTGDRYREGRTLGTLGTAYRVQQRFKEAIECYNDSLRIRQGVRDRLGEGQAYEALGTAFRQQNRFEEAIDALKEGLAIAREIEDRRGESRRLGLLGNIYLEQQAFEDAASCLDESLALARETSARYIESRTLTDLGRLYVNQRRYVKAIASLEESLAIFQEIGDRFAEGQTLGNLGLAAEAAARSYWNEALPILAPLDAIEARKIEVWLDQPEQSKSWWSEWGI